MHWNAPLEDCYCFDLCPMKRSHVCSDEGVNFVGRTRNITVAAADSLWVRYLEAVYNGRTRVPFPLGSLTAFYMNSPAWRTKHPEAPNPFHDCQRSQQRRCDVSTCNAWNAELRQRPAPAPQTISSYVWGQHTWSGSYQDLELRMVQLFSSYDSSIGRTLWPANTWIEIMRADSRPYFEEGMTPPQCPDWQPGQLFLGQRCWDDLHEHNGGRFPPGCWGRPAVGTGVWINTNSTRIANNLTDSASIYAPQASGFNFEMPYHPHRQGTNPFRTVEYVLYARNQGVDTLQFRYGDNWGTAPQKNPPLIVITSDSCVGRAEPLRACLDCGVRSGWADLPCVCDGATHDHTVDAAYLRAVEATVPSRQPPVVEAGSAFPRAGIIQCAVVQNPPSPPPHAPPLTPQPLATQPQPATPDKPAAAVRSVHAPPSLLPWPHYPPVLSLLPMPSLSPMPSEETVSSWFPDLAAILCVAILAVLALHYTARVSVNPFRRSSSMKGFEAVPDDTTTPCTSQPAARGGTSSVRSKVKSKRCQKSPTKISRQGQLGLDLEESTLPCCAQAPRSARPSSLDETLVLPRETQLFTYDLD